MQYNVVSYRELFDRGVLIHAVAITSGIGAISLLIVAAFLAGEWLVIATCVIALVVQLIALKRVDELAREADDAV